MNLTSSWDLGHAAETPLTVNVELYFIFMRVFNNNTRMYLTTIIDMSVNGYFT